MKFIDEKGRFFGKVSIFDLLLVLLVVFAVFAVGMKKNTLQETSGGDKTITYQVTVNKIRDVSVEAIYDDMQNFVDSETGKALGEAIEVTKENAREKVLLEDGKYSFVVYEDRYDVTITLKTSGTETHDAYFTSSGKQIVTGDTIKLKNAYVDFEGEVTKVDVN